MRRSLAEILSNPIALNLINLDKRERTLERLVGMNSKLALSGEGLLTYNADVCDHCY